MFKSVDVGLGGLGVSARLEIQGSNQAEVDGFCQDVKILSTSLPEGNLSWGLK